MPVPREILALVERFQDNANEYLSGRYNETQVRLDFINPLCECLGWDMENRQGYAEVYRDLIHEDAIKVGGANKA
jgi:predicted type IV restriction endonuclease